MRPTRAQVLAAVIAAGPAGLTSADLSKQFDGYNRGTLSTIVSKLAAYGQIDKELMPASRQQYIWRAKP